MSLRHRLPALLLLALPLAAQVTPPTGGPADLKPEPKVLGVDVTYLANEGFFLESGPYSVLIDAFVRESIGQLAALPPEVHRQLANAKPPFDGRTIVLVSHVHPDHVQFRGLEKYLAHNDLAQLMTSSQVIHALRESAQEFELIQRRVTPVPTTKGSFRKLMHEEMSVSFLELQHGGKESEGIVNLGHLIELGGLKILHVGDAGPDPAAFAPYRLHELGIDLAFVPYWFFGSESGARVLNEEIKARTIVACHVPPKEWDEFRQLVSQLPNVVMFQSSQEKRRFLPGGVVEPVAPLVPEETQPDDGEGQEGG
jgi:L-ascorbate metabolism protein UlaG (beta-lactamase superfamily)